MDSAKEAIEILRQGLDPEPEEVCPECNGRETLKCDDCDGHGWYRCECRKCGDEHEASCDYCNGDGYVPCSVC